MRRAETSEQARRLLDEIAALRRAVASEGAETLRRWRPRIERRVFAVSALNFAHYLALRQRDLRPVQRRLMALGLSSLGRVEGRVLASLDAVIVALAALAGVAPPEGVRAPLARQFFRGEALLRANAREIFGPQRERRASRILVTLDTNAADDPAFMQSLAKDGADAARINCAHDDAARWSRMVANIRAASRAAGRPIPVLMDIAGPKPRTGATAAPASRHRLVVGDELVLCRGAQLCGGDAPFQTTCTMPEIVEQLKVGDVVALDDGKLLGRIAREQPNGFVVLIEEGRPKGLKLKPGRGLTFPNADLELDPLTDKDRRDLDFVLSNADMVGYSFVESAAHVEQLQRELAARRADWRKFPLVAKIETARALKNLPEIIVAAAGRQPLAVMIARGDLAVGIGFERLAEMQEEMLWLCEAAHIPAIWATQVLEGLVTKGAPSRGEMTDAAMASRAEVVMLNKGPQLAAGVAALDQLLQRMGEHQVKKTPTLRALHTWSRPSSPAGGRKDDIVAS